MQQKQAASADRQGAGGESLDNHLILATLLLKLASGRLLAYPEERNTHQVVNHPFSAHIGGSQA